MCLWDEWGSWPLCNFMAGVFLLSSWCNVTTQEEIRHQAFSIQLLADRILFLPDTFLHPIKPPLIFLVPSSSRWQLNLLIPADSPTPICTWHAGVREPSVPGVAMVTLSPAHVILLPLQGIYYLTFPGNWWIYPPALQACLFQHPILWAQIIAWKILNSWIHVHKWFQG